jgi:hypothetical protein
VTGRGFHAARPERDSPLVATGSNQRREPGRVPHGPFWVQIPPPPPNETAHHAVPCIRCSPMWVVVRCAPNGGSVSAAACGICPRVTRKGMRCRF